VATILWHKAKKNLRPTKTVARSAKKPPVFQGGYIERIEGRLFLVTTDCEVCTRVPVYQTRRNESIPEGYVPAAALPWMEKYPFEATEETISIGRAHSRRVKGEWVEGEPLMTFARIEPSRSADDPGQFPESDAYWPEEAEKPLRIHLDTKALRRLAEALASDALTLEIDLSQTVYSRKHKVRGYERPVVAWRYGHDRRFGSSEGVLVPQGQPIDLKQPEVEQ
jgi:hypothetical protein